MTFFHLYNSGPYSMGGRDVWDRCEHETLDYETIARCPRLEPRDRLWLDIVEGLVAQQAMEDNWWQTSVLALLMFVHLEETD